MGKRFVSFYRCLAFARFWKVKVWRSFIKCQYFNDGWTDFHKNIYLYKIIEYSSSEIKVELYWARVGSGYSSTNSEQPYLCDMRFNWCEFMGIKSCHFSISNVRFAFWAFFRKPEKLGSHTGSKWWPGDPDVKVDPNDPLTRWHNDPVPCLYGTVYYVCGLCKSCSTRGDGLCTNELASY